MLPLIVAVATVIAAGAIAWAIGQRGPSAGAVSPMAFEIPFVEPPGRGPVPRRSVAISDDGSSIAYTSQSRLWIRQVDEKDAVAVAGTLSAANPFFSLDGTWVGFHGELPGLMKVRVTGGTPEVIAPNAERPTGATWGADGTIVFGTTEGLYRVAASGGQPTLIIKPDPQKKERRSLTCRSCSTRWRR